MKMTTNLFEAGLIKSIADKLRPGPPSIDRIADHEETLKTAGQQKQPENKTLANTETATQQILGQLFSVPSDSSRVILFLNYADLTDRYLTKGGEEKIISSITDDQLAAIFSTANFQLSKPANSKLSFVKLVPRFDLSAVTAAISDSRPYAVILNVSKNVAAHLQSSPPANLDEAKKVLTEIISHDNYIAALNVAAIKKSNVGPLKDQHDREELFNIKKFITSYPVRAIIDAAREEQDERDSHKKITPVNNNDSKPADKPAAAPLGKDDIDTAKQIAFDARRIFFAAASKGKWPTSEDGLVELRNKLVNALTKDQRIGAKKALIPEIVKFFYTNQVKQDAHYHDLIELLNDDPNFSKLVNPNSEEESDANDNLPDASPEAVAQEIKSKGDDFADQVAKILAKKSEP